MGFGLVLLVVGGLLIVVAATDKQDAFLKAVKGGSQ
jgi:hypothetical protein